MNQMDHLIAHLTESFPQLELRREENMAGHTTFRIGGAATLMALPTTLEQLICCCQTARRLQVRLEIIGRGSNLLVADEGVDAFVVSTVRLDYMERTAPHQITAGAGVLLARLANFAAEQGLGGLTFAHGIPGSLGGATTMNGGAYGGEMKDVVQSICAITPQGTLKEILGEEAQFAYRHSLFCNGDLIIAQAVVELPEGDTAQLQEEMAILAAKRRNSQPLEYPSGGSMFKRPEGHYAAALIDQCGLKGFTVGGAQVSEKHAGFVVNRGGATCSDVLELVSQVQQRVLEEKGILLEMEVKILR